MSSATQITAAASLDVLKEYISENCIVRWTESEPIYSSSGRRFSWTFDLRPLLLDGRMLTVVANLFWMAMGRYWPFQVAGLEVAAIPLMAAIVIEGERRGLGTNALIIRQKRKKYGRLRSVEGAPKLDLPVILLDDAINSGRSLNKALVSIKELGLAVEHAFVLAHFHSAMAVNWASINNVVIHNLITPEDFHLPVQYESTWRTEFRVIWTFQSLRPNYRFAVAKSNPVLWEDNLLFGSDSGIFRCLEKDTGRVKWCCNTPDESGKGIVSSPVIADGRVYFGSYSGHLLCLDARTGREIWNVRPCDWIGSSPCYVENHIFIGLEFKSAENQGALGKFCAATGQLKWQINTKQMLHGSPVYSQKHNLIVLGTNDSTVLVLDPLTGTIHRALHVGGPVKYHCALSEDLAVFGSFDGKIYVWDFVKGEIKLALQTDDIVYSRALIVGKRAFIGSADRSFHVIDLEHFCELKCLDVKEKVHSSPSLIGDAVFFGTSGGELIGLHAGSLEVTHRFQFPERLTNSVISDGHLAFVYTYDNKMRAIAW
jgi:outer membrane protein assembly factor BamB/orotate phosphoribosyltransferase